MIKDMLKLLDPPEYELPGAFIGLLVYLSASRRLIST